MMFHEWFNGYYAVVSVAENKVVSLTLSSEEEEGFYEERITFSMQDGVVRRVVETRSRDCDGPHETYLYATCPVDMFHTTEKGLTLGRWERIDAYQRDHYAEMMGY